MGKQVAPASQILQNWQQAMAAPATAQKYTAGINRVQVSPMEAAASSDAQQRYLQGTADAVNSGRMAAALRATTLASWKQQAGTIGAQGLSRGANKGAQKAQSAYQKWQPVYQEASNAAQALPRGGKANALARVSAAMDVMMAAAGKS